MNEPLVIQGESSVTRTLSGDHPSLKIVDCHDVKIAGDFRIVGLSENEGKQDFLVTVIDSGVVFESLVIQGDLEPDDKAYWTAWVPNGLHVTPGSTVVIEHFEGKNLHTGIKIRGPRCAIKSGLITQWSGDGVQVNADYSRVSDLHGTVPLEVFSYEQFHRDFIQLWQEGRHKTLVGCEIDGCTLRAADGENHPWEKGIQGIVGFDGTYKRFYIGHNTIESDIDEHGISFGHLLNSDIFNNTVRSVLGEKQPFIQVSDRKTYKKSYGNRINNNDAELRIERKAANDNKQVKAHTMNSKNKFVRQLSEEQLAAAAAELGCHLWNLEAVLIVESGNQSGYLSDGSIKILYERHIAARQITQRGYDVSQITVSYPAIRKDLSFTPYRRKNYGSFKNQWDKFNRLASLNIKDAEAITIESCSWGAFQVLGNNWWQSSALNRHQGGE